MATTNKKALMIGTALALSFFGVLLLIFSPVFGEGKNGLVFADDLFNKLSKGSSYFIPKVTKSAEKLNGKDFSVALKMEKPEQTSSAAKILATAGAKVQAAEGTLTVSGDLGALLAKTLADSDDMFKNDGAKVKTRYGMDEKEVLAAWWNVLKQMDKSFKKAGKIEESNIVTDVLKKAVEPAYNFYGIQAQQVVDKAGVMTGLLVFYVVYTMWWGFAIFYLFDGVGLTMKKAKVKKEV